MKIVSQSGGPRDACCQPTRCRDRQGSRFAGPRGNANSRPGPLRADRASRGQKFTIGSYALRRILQLYNSCKNRENGHFPAHSRPITHRVAFIDENAASYMQLVPRERRSVEKSAQQNEPFYNTAYPSASCVSLVPASIHSISFSIST